jgi:hypothetical protein
VVVAGPTRHVPRAEEFAADLSIWPGPARRINVSPFPGRRRGWAVARENPMAKFVYVYTGGQMAETPEAQEQAMQAWGAWFGTLGDSVTDMGNPFGNSATVSSGAVTDGGKSGASGYTIVSADSLSDATARAKGCPVLDSGGTVEVYEAIPM